MKAKFQCGCVVEVRPEGMGVAIKYCACHEAAPQLLAACRSVLEGFRYEKGRPVMAEWAMKERLSEAVAAAERKD